ncbi:polyprenyl synthetase [Streptomyces sp. DH12]|uniref:polyprenyl synthetase n=1 Tax=Streptomyces sp. DH12 TaxID=2857010 RepID=UPI001E647360|nr:polyprenyl synthetase [Streptomyces sp. DH12]
MDETGRTSPAGDAVLLVAGLAEVAASGVASLLGGVRGALRRTDGDGLAGDAQEELKARGRLVLDRYATVPPAHLETLARHAAARRAEGGDDRQP